MGKIPVSVIVITKNEEARIGACLEALKRFEEVWVVDSHSDDQTRDIARGCGAKVEIFIWDGRYPKKRQWCLDHLSLKHDRIFFVDADEIVQPALVNEIAALDWSCPGYFVSGLYEFEGRVLKHGLRNNKLALFDRHSVEFPVVDDLGLAGMGEIEGHYQPVLKAGFEAQALGQLRVPMIHKAYENKESWLARHQKYALWEAGMNARRAWPVDPKFSRQMLKAVFRAMAFRSWAAFIHCYLFKLGFLDGREGFEFARSRARYYQMISDASKAPVQLDESARAATERL